MTQTFPNLTRAPASSPRAWWRQLTRGSGAIVVLAFFLPWVAVSCQAPDLGWLTSSSTFGITSAKPSPKPTATSVDLVQASGFQLAIGPTVDLGITKQHLPSRGGLWLVFLSGVVMVAVTFLLAADLYAGAGIAAAAFIAIAALFQNWQASRDAPELSMLQVDARPGLWLSIAGLLIGLTCGLAGLRSARERACRVGGAI